MACLLGLSNICVIVDLLKGLGDHFPNLVWNPLCSHTHFCGSMQGAV